MKTMKSPLGLLALFVVLIAGAAYLTLHRDAVADDADHTTSFVPGTYEYDGPAEASTVATFTTTDTDDDHMTITLWVTPYGLVSEQKRCISETVRTNSDPITLDTAIRHVELGSGDVVRAHFEAFDSSMSSTFSYSRSWTKP